MFGSVCKRPIEISLAQLLDEPAVAALLRGGPDRRIPDALLDAPQRGGAAEYTRSFSPIGGAV